MGSFAIIERGNIGHFVNKQYEKQDYAIASDLLSSFKKEPLEDIISTDKHAVRLLKSTKDYGVKPLPFSIKVSKYKTFNYLNEEKILLEAVSSSLDVVNNGMDNIISYLEELEDELKKQK